MSAPEQPRSGGSVQRVVAVVAAVGDGALAVRLVHEFLARG